MSRNSYILNDFSKKSVLSALKDYDIINMHLSVDGRNQGFYTIFFRRAGYIFCEKILYSGNIYDHNTDVSSFAKISKERIKYRVEIIDDYLNNQEELHKDNFSRASNDIARLIYVQYEFFVNNQIISRYKKSVHQKNIVDNILDLLNGGVNVKQIVNVYFTKFGIVEDLIIDKIIKFENTYY